MRSSSIESLKTVTGPRSSSQLGIDKLPVDKMVDKGIQIITAPVLIVEIIGMLPHIHGQKRLQSIKSIAKNRGKESLIGDFFR